MQISRYSKFVGNLLLLVAKVANHTARIHVSGLSHMEALTAAGYPFLWAAWHGQTMLLLTFMQQYLIGRRATVLIPNDWRGETLFHFLGNLGLRPHPVDLENRGFETARKLAQLVRLIKKEGYDNFLAPDGPGGPCYVVKPGIFFVAHKVGAPILPIGAYGRHVYEINRWDSYALPYPFARLSIAIAPPLELPQEMDEEEKKRHLTTALHHATMQAKANYYASNNPHH